MTFAGARQHVWSFSLGEAAQQLRVLLAAVAVMVCASRQAAAQETDATDSSPATTPQRFIEPGDEELASLSNWTLRTPPTLRREVRRFTFEESELRPLDMPLFFYRYEAADHGFPSFGSMGPRNDHAAVGKWSFGFELGGNSIAARVPTGIIPIVETGQYVVTARVRTEGLVHSRAQLMVWLHDSRGNSIASTRTRSEAIDTKGEWRSLSVQVSAEGVSAADLAIELRLVQPREYLNDPRVASPDAEDVSGRAWFDEVIVWHAPRIELTTDQPGNVFTPMDAHSLEFELRDVASEPLTATLRVYDIAGALVHHQRYNRHHELSDRRTVALPQLPSGWYRASLTAHDGARAVGSVWLDFVLLSHGRRDALAVGGHEFGVELTGESRRNLRDAAAVLDRMNVDSVIVPIWPAAEDSEVIPTGALVAVAEAMLELNRGVIVALDEVPAELASQLGANRANVLKVIAGNSDHWRPHLDVPILALGLEVRRWRLNIAAEQHISGQALESDLRRAAQSLSDFVPDPQFIIPWSVFAERPALSWPAYELRLPSELRPDDIESAMGEWLTAAPQSNARIAPPEQLNYAPRQLVDDGSRRALHVWRSGARQLFIDAPWRVDDTFSETSLPTPMLPVWRVLRDLLSGREYVGELNLPGVEACWIIAGTTAGDAALVAWTGRTTGGPVMLDMLLADGPVTVIDIFGNARIVEPVDNRHRIELGETPVFIEGIDVHLAQFRATFTVEPGAIPSMHKLHEIELVLRNPWDIAVNGMMRVRKTEQWQLNPRLNHFTIEPNGEVRLPVEVIFDRNVVNGRKELVADLSLRSDRTYEITITAPFDLGVSGLHVSAQWQVQRNPASGSDDLLITEHVTNRGAQAITVSAFLYGPGLTPRIRPLGRIEPGATAVQRFHIEDGARLLAGATVRYGVKEMDGSTRLNRVLTIPTFSVNNFAEARP